jgi:uncharacterized protein
MIRAFSAVACAMAAICLAPAQVEYVAANYTKREVEITMRDGVKLFTSIYAPKSTAKPAPFLMMRTPYSCRPYGANAMPSNLGPEASFTREGYIFIYQDVRGRYRSGGDFKWMTPYIPNKKPGQVDESTDTWDTIEWLLKNVPSNNGRVGVYGTSFPGHYAAQCLIDPHPALKAASPQAPMVDNWLGDDMHHNGAFFLPHAMNFIAGFGKVRQGPTEEYGPGVFRHGTPDGYRFFMEMGPLKNALTKYNMNQIPLWKEWTTHGDYDEYWASQNVSQHLKKADKVAILTVGGFWDAEDLYGPLDMYKAIEKNTPNNNNKLIMGPWYHGSWNGGPGDALHDIKWNTKTGEDFRDGFQKPFFRQNLWQDDANRRIPEAAMFDVGADQWRSFDQWPPNAKSVRFVFSANGALRPQTGGQPGTGEKAGITATYTMVAQAPLIRRDIDAHLETRFDPILAAWPYTIDLSYLWLDSKPGVLLKKPSGLTEPNYGLKWLQAKPFVEWISDPMKPVPCSAAISVGMPRQYMIEDQRFVWGRPDVMSFETPVMDHDVTFAGPVKAKLFISSTGTDADFIVKLIDVYPNDAPNNSPRGDQVPMGGYQMMVRGEPFRAKYRNSWSKPSPLTPGKVETIDMTMPDVCYTFKKGHKIMVQVHSTWFPLIDRNPQKFCDIFQASDSDFQKATHRLYVGGQHASGISVEVLGG